MRAVFLGLLAASMAAAKSSFVLSESITGEKCSEYMWLGTTGVKLKKRHSFYFSFLFKKNSHLKALTELVENEAR